MHYNEHDAKYKEHKRRTECHIPPHSRLHLQALDAKHKEVTEALDTLYESIKNSLLKETKEHIVA